ncbi:MAG TPA: hypothetical protein VMW95_07610 [Desulfobacterales bacterium]|nr:hypothetical protein [Desulfobacterales bacterium]
MKKNIIISKVGAKFRKPVVKRSEPIWTAPKPGIEKPKAKKKYVKRDSKNSGRWPEKIF